MRMSRRAALRGGGGKYSWSYSGAHTSQVLTVDGVDRRLITITGSGIFSIDGEVVGGVCLVGGGENGATGVMGSAGGRGGDGAKLVQNAAMMLYTSTITVGAAQGMSTGFGLTAVSAGGTGGGPYRAGDGVLKHPFGISSLGAHSGGGGQGGYRSDAGNSSHESNLRGGAGGTNGGNGGAPVGGDSWGGSGGTLGGGSGGRGAQTLAETTAGTNAAFYGSGGGGGGAGPYNDAKKPGGSGYQGVAYILLPDDTAEAA